MTSQVGMAAIIVGLSLEFPSLAVKFGLLRQSIHDGLISPCRQLSQASPSIRKRDNIHHREARFCPVCKTTARRRLNIIRSAAIPSITSRLPSVFLFGQARPSSLSPHLLSTLSSRHIPETKHRWWQSLRILGSLIGPPA